MHTLIRRRDLLLGTAFAWAACGVSCLSANPSRRAIDVHYHVTTEGMLKAAEKTNSTLGNLPVWEKDKAIEAMDQVGVSTAVISMPVMAPTAPQERADLERFARSANEAAAEIVRDNPHRFRFFAYLPVPFLDSALREATYAIDELNAEGVYLCTSYGDKWLGDSYFTPMLEEFNRRSLRVYTHPMGAECCYDSLVPDVPSPIVEYGTDTTRTIASLVFSGAAERYPDVKFIFSHAGGTMPFLFERFDRLQRSKDAEPEVGMRELLSRFYYDTAQVANPYALGTLLRLIPESQVLFGSDVPWREAGQQLDAIESLALEPATLEAIFGGNARRLLGIA